MPQLVIPRGAYRRTNGNFPPFELVNMFLEVTPAAKGGHSLLSFPGLESTATRGAGPINGIFRKPDLFSGDVFTVSNGALYRGATLLGTINGSGPVSWAATNTELVVTRGQTAYSYNGTNLAAITFPDSANVTAVTAISERVIFARASSYRIYWSALLDARTVDALDYASAESSPDWIRDVLAIGDSLFLGGKDTIEVWFPTGDGTLPFRRITQRTASVGVADTGCMVELDNALHFIGSDRAAHRMADVPKVISHHGIDELLAAATTFRCFTMIYQGHPVLYVRLDDSTHGFDVRTTEWHERRTWGLSNWVAGCACQQDDGTTLFGSAVGDDLLEHSGWAEGTSPLSREFTAAIPLDGPAHVDVIELEANPGSTTDLTITEPKIEMSYSRDGGRTFGPYRTARLGATGQYRARPRWRVGGIFNAPGVLCRFRVTDAVPLRVSSAHGQESAAGRARA